jgi:hypothetical protein
MGRRVRPRSARQETKAYIAEILSTVAENTDQSRPFSASQRLQFMRQLNEIVPQHFNMLLFAVNPPAALIPPMPAPQGDRTSALLTWAEASGGCGLSVLEELLDRKSSPIPPSSSTVNSKLGQDPGTSFEPYPVPILAVHLRWSLWRHLLPQVQTQKHHRRYFPHTDPRHKLLGANAFLSVGQSYKDFYIRKP